MHLQTSWHAISGHKMGMLIHSPPKTIHKQLPILKKSSHLSGTGLKNLESIWTYRIGVSPASFPEVPISRLRTASKIENITAMKNRSLPVIRCCAELKKDAVPNWQEKSVFVCRIWCSPMDHTMNWQNAPINPRIQWIPNPHGLEAVWTMKLQCFFTCKRGKLGKWPSRRNTELSRPQVWVNI